MLQDVFADRGVEILSQARADAVHREGDGVVVTLAVPSFNTALGRKKPANLEHDPRAALLVIDPSDAYKWVAIDGRTELTTDGADPQIDKLAKKYLGKDEYPWRQEGEERVTVRIQPERVTASGLDG